ncbi:hypothetical protein CNR22_21320 [Sphingobacteriaceae bacterium]|nr:hypothetical protein CNR22_21320 [Sphingobacteriaceae bacterium]
MSNTRIEILMSTCLFILTAFLPACKKKEVSEFTDSPIIDGYLRPNDYLSVKISRQIPFSSDVKYSSDDINNLSVIITDKDAHIYSLKPVGDGRYVDSTTVVTAGNSYTLSFTYNKKEVQAYTYIPDGPQNATQSLTELTIEKRDTTTRPTPGASMPDPVKINWSNPDNSYYLVLIENTETDPEAITDFRSNAPPARIFRKSPSNFSSEEVRAMEFQYFGKTRIILYHVLPDYATLYDQGSTSSQNLTNPSTSIKNGYGIFTGLNSDTLWVDVKKK